MRQRDEAGPLVVDKTSWSTGRLGEQMALHLTPGEFLDSLPGDTPARAANAPLLPAKSPRLGEGPTEAEEKWNSGNGAPSTSSLRIGRTDIAQRAFLHENPVQEMPLFCAGLSWRRACCARCLGAHYVALEWMELHLLCSWRKPRPCCGRCAGLTWRLSKTTPAIPSTSPARGLVQGREAGLVCHLRRISALLQLVAAYEHLGHATYVHLQLGSYTLMPASPKETLVRQRRR